MNNAKKRPKKRRSLMGAIKTLIVSLSLASILGFWSLFSQQNDLGVLASTTSNISLVQPSAEPALALDLPPMPTLIPPLDPSTIVQQPAAAPVVSQPELRPGSTVVLGGSKPSSGGGGGGGGGASAGSSAGAGAVTVTQSSQ
ncbi:MAG: hypothetical protein HN413_04250 [Chloroflexi bacterium]|jgi:hypothetical protein|nr:hypothetical protein [Chloroflexota bacterium]